MKEDSIKPEKQTLHQVDKRDLVNLDLYDHEIKVIEEQLKQVAGQHKSKETQKKHSQLKKELIRHKQKLQRFRSSYQLQQDYSAAENTNINVEKSSTTEGEGFFEHLKAFEESFKNTRNKVNDFLSQ